MDFCIKQRVINWANHQATHHSLLLDRIKRAMWVSWCFDQFMTPCLELSVGRAFEFFIPTKITFFWPTLLSRFDSRYRGGKRFEKRLLLLFNILSSSTASNREKKHWAEVEWANNGVKILWQIKWYFVVFFVRCKFAPLAFFMKCLCWRFWFSSTSYSTSFFSVALGMIKVFT